MEYIDDAVLRVRTNKYEQTRERIERYSGKHSISDKEIIEYLADEIEQYRNKIRQLQESIEKKKNIDTEISTYHCNVNGGTGEDFNVIRWYEDGVLIKEEIKPCNNNTEK